MAKVMGSHSAVAQALVDAGIVDDSNYVRRVVIDISWDGPVMVYIERFTDERIVNVMTALGGVEIKREDRP